MIENLTRLSALALLVPGLVAPVAVSAQAPTAASLEEWIRSGYEFSWERGQPMRDEVRLVWGQLGSGGVGFGFRTFQARAGAPDSIPAMEHWRVTLDELHTSVVGDIGLAWGVHTEEFEVEGEPPDTVRVRFTSTLRWNGQRWENLLYHRDAQVFGETGRPTPAGPTVGPASAPAQSGGTVSFEFKQCNEDVLVLRVDPEPVERVVGAGFPLELLEGKAVVAIMVQDCSQYWIDGEDLGPNRHVHVLARIRGPGDVRPVVGAQRTEPTMTWFSLFAGSTNPRGRAARMASGTAPEPIDSVSVDPPGTPRGGRVVLGPDLRFAWNVPTTEPSALLMGVNHDIYLRDPSGDTLLKRIQALGRLEGVPTPGALEVQGPGRLGDLVEAGRYPVLVYSLFPIWARGNLGEPAGR